MDDISEFLTEHLQARASRYYPEMSYPTVRLRTAVIRPRATLYFFDLSEQRRIERLIVKVATEAESYPVDDRRPQVADVPGRHVRHRLEYASMLALEASIESTRPDGIGAVHVLDEISDLAAYVMEQVEGRDLGDIFGDPGPDATPTEVGELIEKAGRWLAHFHRLELEEELDPLHTSIEDYLGSVRQQTDFLGHELRRSAYFDALAASIEERVAAVGPLRMPMGLRHGDYKPENLMVRSDGAIVGIDAVPEYRSVIYEDIAKFTVRLALFASPMMRQHVMARSLRPRVPRYRDLFLAGYFGAEEPHRPEVALYEVLRALHDWSKRLVQQQLPRSGRSKARRRVALSLANRYFNRGIERLVSSIGSRPQKPE